MLTKKTIRRIFIFSGSGILIVLILMVVAKHWIIPTTIEALIKNKLKSSWSGPVTIGEVEFDYEGSLSMDRLLLEDKSGKQFILLSDIHVQLDSWKDDLKIESIDIATLKVQMFLDFKSKSSKQGSMANVLEKMKGDRLKIGNINIRDITFDLIKKGEQTPRLHYGNLSFNASMNEDGMICNLKQAQVQEANDHFELSGKIDPTFLHIRFVVNGHHDFSYEEFHLLMQLYGVETLYTCKGAVSGNFEISRNIIQDEFYDVAADLDFIKIQLKRAESVLIENMSFELVADGSKCNLSNVIGSFCGGSINGKFFMNNIFTDKIEYSGDVVLKAVQLAKLSDAFQTKRRFTEGEGFGKYIFAMNGLDFKNIQGNGIVYVKDANLDAVPSVSQVFYFIGLGEYVPTNVTDLIAVFENTGSAVKLEKAMIANKLSAIKTQKGGKLNFSSKTIDTYVVVVPFKTVGDVFEGIPIINILSGISDNMIRLRIRGKWTDSPNKLISKEPLGDVTEGTIVFLRDVLENKGSIRKENFDSLIKSVKEK